uniref:Uncharacterized protein n=1 Tax=Branchiostoma floridae TaxID=7739 RepID=C3ZZG1_BRAFL|eukprot:XP_002586059.1 hypothetical protein BRAFLDRAFT_107291 [Branchiostoma floridae]
MPPPDLPCPPPTPVMPAAFSSLGTNQPVTWGVPQARFTLQAHLQIRWLLNYPGHNCVMDELLPDTARMELRPACPLQLRDFCGYIVAHRIMATGYIVAHRIMATGYMVAHRIMATGYTVEHHVNWLHGGTSCELATWWHIGSWQLATLLNIM